MTLEKLKLYLGITGTAQDEILGLFLQSSIDYIYGYIGRDLESQEYTEIINGDAQRVLILKNYPVTALALFQNTGTISEPIYDEVSDNAYSIDKSGVVSLTFLQRRGLENYKAVYTAGYNPIPGDIQLAILKYASLLYNRKDGDGIKGESVGGDSIQYETQGIPGEIQIVLDKYRNV